jgi:radical SAM superfamily enzyme YgiQ (UPF0313 family)
MNSTKRPSVLLIGDSRGSCREHFITASPSKRDIIGQLSLSLECKLDDNYFDALDLANYLNKGTLPFKDSVPENPEDFLLLSNTISLGGIFLLDYLEQNGYHVDYIANFFTQKKELAAGVEKNPLAVLISSTFLNMRQLIDMIDFLEECMGKQRIPIIAGGQLIDYLAHFQKYVIQFNRNTFRNVIMVWEAKGEKTLLQLLGALANGISPAGIPNLIYFDGGRCVETPRQAEQQAIEHHLISWDRITEEHLRVYVPVRTSEGCPFNCTFCTFAKLHRKINLKSLEVLEKELRLIARRNKVKHVMLVDDLVAITRERLKAIASMMARNNFPFTWSAMLRSDSIADEDTVRLLKESRLSLANLGIESFDAAVLENMKKREGPAAHFRAIELLKKYDIFINGFFIFGFPGETPDSIERTTRGIIQSEIDLCEVHLWNNVPGAPIHSAWKGHLKGSYENWRHDTMDAPQCMKHIVEVFKQTHERFGMLDDNVLPLVMLQAEGYSNQRIKTLYRTRSALIMNRLESKAREEHLLEQLRDELGGKPR